MGIWMSKPRSSEEDNSQQNDRTRSLGGSNSLKKPAIFKSFSKPKDKLEVKSATGNIDATTSTSQSRSTPIAADSRIESDDAVQARNEVELDAKVKESGKLQFKLKKEELFNAEESLKCEINADKVLDNAGNDFNQRSQTSQLSSITSGIREHKPEADEPESGAEVECSNQESRVAESLVEEALQTGIEIRIADLEPSEKVPTKPASPAKCEPLPSEPQSSEQTSDYTEVLQQTPSVSEFLADAYDKSDSIKVAGFANDTTDCRFKKVSDDATLEPDVVGVDENFQEASAAADCATNGHDKSPYGDDGEGCAENKPKSTPIASRQVVF